MTTEANASVAALSVIKTETEGGTAENQMYMTNQSRFPSRLSNAIHIVQ